ncbi:TetR/AcrR family transcriptional regulator [Streptomyces scopuliridis]|uniref:TetR/AcrR family transcriptional regulator n=1 Tax=Streptomyces scopuliridis TaxID=452529 RepID=UPI0036AD0C0A
MTPSPAPDTPSRPQRADARRNGERLLTTARDAFAEYGTDAPLEEIARRAGVGIGTLYRHFPTRQALLQAVLHDRLEALHSEAVPLLDNPAPADALLGWLRSVALHATRYRGLAAALLLGVRDEDSPLSPSCGAVLTAGAELLHRAQRAGQIRPDVTAADLYTLANSVAWAAEETSTSRSESGPLAARLLTLTMEGLRTH